MTTTYSQLVLTASSCDDAGTTPPCMADPAPFLDDDRALRGPAADRCQTCPILVLCGTYALESGQRFGVWGGVDLTPLAGSRPGRKLLAERLAAMGSSC